MDVEALRRTIEALNEKIRPIAETPVEFGPDLLVRLAAMPKPLDQAGVRDEAEKTLIAAVDLYLRCSAADREQIREMFRTNRAFTWAAVLPFPADSAERFRKHLAHFSIVDPYPDDRDALLWLADLRKSRFFEPLRDEIARLSSETTRDMLSAR